MSNHYLRLTNHNIFNNVAHDRLHAFLAPFAEYLADRKIELKPGPISEQSREQIRIALRRPDDDTPRALLQSAHFVNDLCNEHSMLVRITS